VDQRRDRSASGLRTGFWSASGAEVVQRCNSGAGEVAVGGSWGQFSSLGGACGGPDAFSTAKSHRKGCHDGSTLLVLGSLGCIKTTPFLLVGQSCLFWQQLSAERGGVGYV
jgi:hypothetical protein